MASFTATQQAPAERRFARVVYGAAALVAVVGAALIVGALAAATGWLPVAKPLVSSPSAGNVATFTVAGATLLLADFTALLAWFTWQSIAATRREARIAEAALVAANRQAEAADMSLNAIQEQAKIAERQVEATNRQAQIAQDQLAASWRPLVVEPRMTAPPVEIHPALDQSFGVQVQFVNIGRGPAFVRKAFLTLGVAGSLAVLITPGILEPEGTVEIAFNLKPKTDGVDRSIAQALLQGSDLAAVVLYHDIGKDAAWRSKGRLTMLGTSSWVLTDVEVSPIEMTFLD